MKYRIALVEYLNTLPFSEGLKLSGIEQEFEVHRVVPSACAQMFKDGLVDLSLCPVGALNELPEYEICGHYCIGADGPVDSVMLLSKVPLEEIRSVRFDDHSRTSNLLVQILAKHFWNQTWDFDSMNGDNHESFVMIGDKVFSNKEKFAFQYDLAGAWKTMTGLPMIFAVWIKRPGIPEEIAGLIDRSFETGMKAMISGEIGLREDMRDYLLYKISYPLDKRKLEALTLYQSLIP